MQIYPAALQYIGRGGGNILSCMWFAMLFLLGIDSIFSVMEAAATVFTDTPRFRHVRKELVAALLCFGVFLLSLTFATDIGMGLIDAFDHYVINYCLFFTGALEAYVVSWVWGWPEIVKKCGWTCAPFRFSLRAIVLVPDVRSQFPLPYI